jgi:hypothetical protein
MKKEIIAKGKVVGNCWGGGVCGYASETVTATTLKELDDKIREGIKTGSLDGGMGFESLIGAIMYIETTETIELNGFKYHRHTNKTKRYGDTRGF